MFDLVSVLGGEKGKKLWATKSGVVFLKTRVGYLPYAAGICPFKWNR